MYKIVNDNGKHYIGSSIMPDKQCHSYNGLNIVSWLKICHYTET